MSTNGTLYIERFEKDGDPRVEVTIYPDDKELSGLSVRFDVTNWDILAQRSMLPGEVRLQTAVTINE